jgi:hypothetical protein
MNWTLDDLYDLLPVAYRSRDAELDYPLRSLLAVIAEQAEVMESDIDRLYDNWFIETCDDWVVPYIGQLLGLRTLNNVENSPSYSQRSRVGNLIGYRRRKGTPGMLEQLARDTTGWNARVVEFFDLLITTQHYNHVRLHSTHTVDLRRINELELIDTPFDKSAHTVDIRNINQSNGWHNLSNIGLFLWPLQSYYIQRCTAVKLNKPSNQYYFSQAGRNMPLFNRPRTEKDLIQITDEVNLPGRLRRLPIMLELNARRREIASKQNNVYLRLAKLRQIIIKSDSVFNKNNFEQHVDALKRLVDNESAIFSKLLIELGQIVSSTNDKLYKHKELVLSLLHKAMIAVSDIKADYFSIQPVFQIFVKAVKDYYYELLPEEIIICDFSTISSPSPPATLPVSENGGSFTFENLVAVDPLQGRLAFPTANVPQDVLVSYAYGFSGDVGGGPYDRRVSVASLIEPAGRPKLNVTWQASVGKSLTPANNVFDNIDNALESWTKTRPGQIGILTITDNQTHVIKSETVNLPAGSKLFIVSADWPAVKVQNSLNNSDSYQRRIGIVAPTEKRAHIKGDLTLETKVQGIGTNNSAELIINGLLIDGNLTVVNMNEVSLDHSTITGNCKISYCQNGINLERCVLKSLQVNSSPKLNMVESIIGESVEAEYTKVNINRVTVLGTVSVEILEASNSIFAAGVTIKRGQSSCVRFSYIGPEYVKSCPNFRCQPGQAPSQADSSEMSAVRSRVVPLFNSKTLFEPNYCQLSTNCANEIKTGAEDGSEMGVFGFLKNSQREANILASLDEFLPLGLKATIIPVPHG